MTWFRHFGESHFHLGSPRDGSRILHCNGRWPLFDEDRGEVERHANPATALRCSFCVRRGAELEAERAEAHLLADTLTLMQPVRPAPDETLLLAREVRRLRHELESCTHELHFLERELADAHEFIKLSRRGPAQVVPQ